jgi:very-short-patch-repair endonuclease
LNERFGDYAIDVTLRIEGVQIAIEYDSWYFHGGCEARDRRRDQVLLEAGWRVLRIRSPGPLPLKQELDAALERILAGERYMVLTLPGWGEGPTLNPLGRKE